MKGVCSMAQKGMDFRHKEVINIGFLSPSNDIVITWDKIRCIGDNVILVEI